MNQWKASIRAWLIDLVREAVRSESVQPGNSFSLVAGPTSIPDNPAYRSADMHPGRVFSGVTKEAWDKAVIDSPTFGAEPSFEQMQSAAIAEQAKYYEVAK